MIVELRVEDFIRYSLAFSVMVGYLLTLRLEECSSSYDDLENYVIVCNKLCRTTIFRRNYDKDSYVLCVCLDSYFTKEVLCKLLEKLEAGMKLLRIVRGFDVAKGSDLTDLEIWEEFEIALEGIIEYMPSK